MRHHLIASVRVGEWWDFKLVPMLSAFYATALIMDVPVSSLWKSAVALLLAIAASAVYVSVINDVSDQTEDAAAGKPNRIAGQSSLTVVFLLAVPSIVGLGFLFLWRGDLLLAVLYVASWAAFSLYSLPPFRLKARGVFGVLADASGAHLFPTLLAVVLAAHGAGRSFSIGWLLAVGVWAFACGLRGILWHQLSDAESDRLIGVRTFVLIHSPRTASHLGTFVVFPLELAALAAMLVYLRSSLPATLLAAYALFAIARTVWSDVNNVIVVPRPHYRVVLNEYYEVFLPIAVLTASAIRHPLDWWLVAVHLLLFHKRPRDVLRDARRVARTLAFSPRG